MIWLSWRLQRLETSLVAAALLLAAAALVPLGLHMASVYDNSGVGACLAHGGSGCGATVEAFRHRFEHAGAIIPWLNFLPGLIGVLFAAPLVLDFEHATFRFAWTQSVPRGRWLMVRLTVMCAAALLATFALTRLMTWFRGPLDHVSGRMDPGVFDFEGIVPYAYTLFAISLALALGIFTRRLIVATGGALLGYFALRIGIQSWLREHYLAPVRVVWKAGTPGPRGLDHAWNLLSGPSDAHGSPLPARAFVRCMGASKQQTGACLNAHHIYNLASYQPANRFWLFQGIEAAIFTGLAATLIIAAAWWLRHRIG